MSILNNITEAPERGLDIPDITMAYAPGKITRPPSHPGVVIEDLLQINGLSLRAAAKAMNVAPTTLGNIIAGKPVTVEMALRLGVYFWNGPDLWLNMQQAYDLWHAREKLKDDLKLIKPVVEKV